MKITITKDNLDNSNWINVDFVANENCLDHDKIIWLEALRHKHKLSGGTSEPSSMIKHCTFTDSATVHIENPTVEFEKDLMLWRMS